MQLTNSDISTTPYPTHRSLRHFSRARAPSHGPDHTTLIIIIAVSASVGGLLLILIWRFLSRFLHAKSAPLPPRQSPVHQRELRLAVFTEYKDAGVPEILTDGSYTHATDETTPESSYGVQLHPPLPHFFSPRTPPNGSSSSLPLSIDSAPSSGTTTPPISTSTCHTQSSRRAMSRSGPDPRPLSAFSTSSRKSIRAAPHAPHSNVQIILPAPLAPGLYEGTASDGPLLQRPLGHNCTYSVRDNWRPTLADPWISVGQDRLPDSKQMERQYGHDNMERPTRLLRRGSSPGPLPRRSRSNLSSLSPLRPSSGTDQLLEGSYPPVPPVPSEFETLPGHHAVAPSPFSTDSHKPRS